MLMSQNHQFERKNIFLDMWKFWYICFKKSVITTFSTFKLVQLWLSCLIKTVYFWYVTLLVFFHLYWGIIDIEKWYIFRCTTWCFDICMHCEIIITIKLINTSITSRTYHFLFPSFLSSFLPLSLSSSPYTHIHTHLRFTPLAISSM